MKGQKRTVLDKYRSLVLSAVMCRDTVTLHSCALDFRRIYEQGCRDGQENHHHQFVPDPDMPEICSLCGGALDSSLAFPQGSMQQKHQTALYQIEQAALKFIEAFGLLEG